jgi:hypothetical protein
MADDEDVTKMAPPNTSEDYKVVGMSGWLQKKGKDMFQAWKRRWCVFNDKSKTLIYFDGKQNEGGVQKGSIALLAFWDIPDRPGATIARFDLKASDGLLYAMSAPSEAQKAVWVAKLSAALGVPLSLTEHPRAAEFQGLSVNAVTRQIEHVPLNIPTGHNNMTLAAYKDENGQLKVRLPEQEKLRKEKDAEKEKKKALALQQRLEHERKAMQAQRERLGADVAAKEQAWEAEKAALKAEHLKDKAELQQTIQMDMGDKEINTILAQEKAQDIVKKEAAWEKEKKTMEEQWTKETQMLKDTLNVSLSDAQKQVRV